MHNQNRSKNRRGKLHYSRNSPHTFKYDQAGIIHLTYFKTSADLRTDWRSFLTGKSGLRCTMLFWFDN